VRSKILAIGALVTVALSASACATGTSGSGNSGAGSQHGQAETQPTFICKLEQGGHVLYVSITAGSKPLGLSNVGVQLYDSDGQPTANGPVGFTDSDGNALYTLAPFKTVTRSIPGYSSSTSCQITGLGE
jgi:hypothetical protein